MNFFSVTGESNLGKSNDPSDHFSLAETFVEERRVPIAANIDKSSNKVASLLLSLSLVCLAVFDGCLCLLDHLKRVRKATLAEQKENTQTLTDIDVNVDVNNNIDNKN